MEKVKIVLVGVGGYGDIYVSLFRARPDLYGDIACIVGVVDPFAKQAAKYDWIIGQNIPIYDTLEAFYQNHTADLAVISTPIPLHKDQCITAMAHGSSVLCEKPITPTVDDANALLDAVRSTGKRLGVGFQWSFSKSMNRLKADILSGKFGRPVELRSLICWKRDHAYYGVGGWKGRVRTKDGALILDSVVTNATAHYLHNIFFILGDAGDTAALPTSVTAEVYRAKNIESFDTVALRGAFANGAKFWYGATHSNDEKDVTAFRYTFEKAEIHFNILKQDDHMYAVYPDGETVDYGNPQAFEELNPKFLTMIRSCRADVCIPCTVETALPHLKVCNGLFAKVGIATIPPEYTFEDAEHPGTYVRGMSAVMAACFDSAALPSELNAPWAVGPVTYQPGEITTFEGVKER